MIVASPVQATQANPGEAQRVANSAASPDHRIAQEEAATSSVTRLDVSGNGIVGELNLPKAEGRLPALIVVGYCTPGFPIGTARQLANYGFVALGLHYCGRDNLPAQLQEIPLEYFKAAIDWLRSQPSVDAGHIGLVGSSAGAEAALVIAATYPEINAVVAIAPSSVVWQGYGTSPKPIYTAEPKSAWTLMGKPFPFVPFVVPSVVNFQGEIYANSLHVASHEAAIIPVERINCPILLISGTDDRSWPSDEMARELVDRLKRTRFRFPYEHLSYPNAGHAFFSARDLSSDPKAAEGFRHALERSIDRRFGGTTEGNESAQADAWRKTLRFLDDNLKAGPSGPG